jgi:predicted AAA+ superfamily ATPase
MKSIHILTYDLENDSPLLQSIIDQGNNVLGEIILFVQQTNQEAGRICRENIPENVLSAFSELPKDQLSNDIQRIREHNSLILDVISEKIANTHIDRDDCISDINDILRSYSAAFLSGNRGCGKSALVKAYSESLDNVFFLIFRAEELDSTSLLNAVSSVASTRHCLN